MQLQQKHFPARCCNSAIEIDLGKKKRVCDSFGIINEHKVEKEFKTGNLIY